MLDIIDGTASRQQQQRQQQQQKLWDFFCFLAVCVCVCCICVYVYIFNHCYFSLTKVPSGADVFFLSLNGPCRLYSISLPLSLTFTCEWTLWNCKHSVRGSCLGRSGPQSSSCLAALAGSHHCRQHHPHCGSHTWFCDSLQFCIFIVYHLLSNVLQLVLALQLNRFSIWIDRVLISTRVGEWMNMWTKNYVYELWI